MPDLHRTRRNSTSLLNLPEEITPCLDVSQEDVMPIAIGTIDVNEAKDTIVAIHATALN